MIHLRHEPKISGESRRVAGAGLDCIADGLSTAGRPATRLRFPVGTIWIYLRTTQPRDRVGSLGFWAYTALLSAIYLGSAFGPPAPSAQVVAWSAVALWVFPFWAAWIDRHRAVVTAETPAVRTARVQ